jgi:protein SCO1
VRRLLGLLGFWPALAPAAQQPALLQQIDVVEKLGDRAPLDLPFTDAQGQPFTLRQLASERRPTLLVLGYPRCPQLCSLLLSGIVRALGNSALVIGRDFRAVDVSIDPSETTEDAAEQQRGQLQALGQGATPESWPFVHGREPEIRALAEAVGFQYAYDPQSRQFAHDAAAFVLTPDGRIARYLYGVEPTPRDLELALVEASNGRIGTSLDRILLACYQWDPASRRYGPNIRRFLQGGGAMVFGCLAGLLMVLWRKERHAS